MGCSSKKYEIQNVLKSSLLNVTGTKFLFTARARMLFLKNNYKNGTTDTKCDLCDKDDTQENLLSC